MPTTAIREVRLYESNADHLYIQADDGPVWDIGVPTDNGGEYFANDAAAWAYSAWSPNAEEHTQTTADGLTHVATWLPNEDGGDHTGRIRFEVEFEQIGGAQAEYLGPDQPIPFDPGTGPERGFVAGHCGHRVARSEWRAGFRNCERC